MLTDLLLVALAYLLGSLSTAILVCRALGLSDPRTQGSGNPGATNVLRLGGKPAAALTLAGDLLKGLVPVVVARWLGAPDGILALVALAAFLGHLYPVFFGFQGGKGVATALGVLLGLSWPAALAALGTWLLMAALFRISSLSALTAAVMAPFYIWVFLPVPEILVATFIMAVFLMWRHRGNIYRLLNGTEGRIGSKDR
jgi:acyl phosphate:glycerol-3-phosphate acyltransferase